jgi:drug/metabolite transporter (DMT)-like permease
MNWFFIALLAPALYAATNHIDKYLLSRYFKSGEVGSLVLFSSLFSFFALPIIYFIEPAVFSVRTIEIFALVTSGALAILALVLYFYALERDEASVIVPFYQTIPIFSFILGYFILGETLQFKSILGCLLIIIGAATLSLDLTKEKIKVKTLIVFYMLGASFLFAVNGVIFKLVALESGFWTSAFWSFFGRVAIGILIYFFVKSYREQFWQVIHMNKASVILINSFNETIYIIADGILYFASLLAPIAIVMTVNSVQPLFVLIFGIIITFFFPRIGRESLAKKNILQKIIAVIIICIGSYLISK